MAVSFDIIVRRHSEQLGKLALLPSGSDSAGIAAASNSFAAILRLRRFRVFWRNDAALISKRVFDLLGATLLLWLFSPLLIFVYCAIQVTSPGPAIFRQMRVGFDGIPFEIYKFRTMTVAENGPAVLQARRRDARVTTLGRFLRRSSIDELPQLVNVLKGEMSLIGPRPHAIAHDEKFALQSENYVLRRRMKPGITGWAQVNGARGGVESPVDLQIRVNYDLQYVERWGIWLDSWILIRTIFTLFSGKNAY